MWAQGNQDFLYRSSKLVLKNASWYKTQVGCNIALTRRSVTGLQFTLITLIILLICTHHQKNNTTNLKLLLLYFHAGRSHLWFCNLMWDLWSPLTTPSWLPKKYRAAKWGKTIPSKWFPPYKGNETLKHQIYFRWEMLLQIFPYLFAALKWITTVFSWWPLIIYTPVELFRLFALLQNEIHGFLTSPLLLFISSLADKPVLTVVHVPASNTPPRSFF